MKAFPSTPSSWRRKTCGGGSRRKGLESYLKCTGGKGLHVSVPLAEKNKWEDVKAFCAGVAETMVEEVPDAYVATMSKAKRKGKIFVDYFRNDYTATAIADYSVRARAGAPVAVPLEWRELDGLRAANQFTIAEVLKRLKKQPPDSARYENRQKLPGSKSCLNEASRVCGQSSDFRRAAAEFSPSAARGVPAGSHRSMWASRKCAFNNLR